MAVRQPGRTLGIDPGSQITGYGVLEKRGSQVIHIHSGYVRLSSLPSLPSKLRKIYTALQEVVQEYRPTEVAVEKVFFAKNVQSALVLGHVRGVALLSAVDLGLKFFEYSPLEIKKAVTGYGRADKRQVQAMVQALVGLESIRIADVSDALAVALCHLNWLYPLLKQDER